MTAATYPCCTCKREKPDAEFNHYTNRRGERKRHSQCKACHRAVCREYERRSRLRIKHGLIDEAPPPSRPDWRAQPGGYAPYHTRAEWQAWAGQRAAGED